MKLAIVTLCLVFLVGFNSAYPGHPSNYSVDVLWSVFKNQYGRKYGVDEEPLRKLIFASNVRQVAKHNQKFGYRSYRMAVNQFADLTTDEIEAVLKHVPKFSGSELSPNNVAPPTSFDWRSQGVVSPVQDQGQLGSPIDFGLVGSAESVNAIKLKGKIQPLSVSQVGDCYTGDAFVNEVLAYLVEYGLEEEQTYKQAPGGGCGYNRDQVKVNVTGGVTTTSGSETELQAGVYQNGPTAVLLTVDNNLIFYGGGIYSSVTCSKEAANHMMLAVGYGCENGTDYWILKNSWGSNWGENGYVRLARNQGNTCGVASNTLAIKIVD